MVSSCNAGKMGRGVALQITIRMGVVIEQLANLSLGIRFEKQIYHCALKVICVLWKDKATYIQNYSIFDVSILHRTQHATCSHFVYIHGEQKFKNMGGKKPINCLGAYHFVLNSFLTHSRKQRLDKELMALQNNSENPNLAETVSSSKISQPLRAI